MKFVNHLETETFARFVHGFEQAHFMQTPEWGEMKSPSGWVSRRIGIEHQGELVGAALLLIRRLPLIRYSIMYAPRGFMVDFTNREALQVMTEGIKALGKKQRSIFLKVDPELIARAKDISGSSEPDQTASLPYKPNEIIRGMEELGYRHQGDELNFDGVQPRFSTRVSLLPEEEIMKGFHAKTQYNIRLSARKGVEIVKGAEADIDTFTRIMEVTGKRDGFVTRDEEYFKRLYRILKPKGIVELYLAKINPVKAIAHLQKQLDDTQRQLNRLDKTEGREKDPVKSGERAAKKETLQKKLLRDTNVLQSMEQMAKEHPDGLVVSGASDNVFRDYMPNYLIQWEMMKEAKKRGCTMYDFGGISGDLSPDNPLWGLYKFKKGFGGQFLEFIGEFN
ncbi:aminoacyltransferase FemX [Paenibacillus larvae subsp. larvae]|uniref:Lipid II:glycine glycyltransferase n=2 Tax=Paenibacillus larvae TaxID=1464 RepID=A0A2L1U0I7_9BACL|nr:peptidoglycan bridge formation glycyltransferase FemA/FemB family protein [Paenibacillus larvae]AVF26449.1 aminoacyltransferase FemX [Paenibacillus larvae subsp. larvae]AVF31225.1 aminoacyltransferase FemX [Paenibacillus larvae subsp. larvae]MCY7520522.1 aminoacyltransferase [Paenibacillus larvae]MCY9502583.1 aminoacyltransferase [Paenibacillus larvae]MCY9680712.1 aminoacyltransferase [Paenibacillus larvae]